MNLITASLILRQHMALIDEGIGPKDPDPNDAVVLAAAVHVAGHLYTTAELHDFRLVDEDGTPTGVCPAQSWLNEVPCTQPLGHPRISGPDTPRRAGYTYDHGDPDAGVYWNEK